MTPITIACPEALIADANNLAAVLGYSDADLKTFGAAEWVDQTGNRYAAINLGASSEWLATAKDPLNRPAWDMDRPYRVNMAAAQRAQAALHMCGPGVQTAIAKAQPDCLIAVVGGSAAQALDALGLGNDLPEED